MATQQQAQPHMDHYRQPEMLAPTAEFLVAAPASGTLLIPPGSAMLPAHRIVVLVPRRTVDMERLALAVCDLSHGDTPVLCLTLSPDPEMDTRAFGRLAWIASSLRILGVDVRTCVVDARAWPEGLSGRTAPGDLIVCPAEQRISGSGFRRTALGPALVERLHVPVYAMGGLMERPTVPWLSALLRLMAAIAPIAIVAGFFWIQVQIGRATSGLTNTLLIAASALVELGLIVVWSAFQDRMER